MIDDQWFKRVDPDHRYLMEKDAFNTFLSEPFTAFTRGLLRFVLKNLFVRLFIYDYIPVEKWTLDVCDTVCEVLKQHPTELMFIPMLYETKNIYTYVIDKYPRCFQRMIPFFEKLKIQKQKCKGYGTFESVYDAIWTHYLCTQNRSRNKKKRKNDWAVRRILKKKK